MVEYVGLAGGGLGDGGEIDFAAYAPYVFGGLVVLGILAWLFLKR
jgi:hypothetical protein